VSFVTVGDGSVNNAHFLSATNFADYLNHRKIDVCILSRSFSTSFSILSAIDWLIGWLIGWLIDWLMAITGSCGVWNLGQSNLHFASGTADTNAKQHLLCCACNTK